MVSVQRTRWVRVASWSGHPRECMLPPFLSAHRGVSRGGMPGRKGAEGPRLAKTCSPESATLSLSAGLSMSVHPWWARRVDQWPPVRGSCPLCWMRGGDTKIGRCRWIYTRLSLLAKKPGKDCVPSCTARSWNSSLGPDVDGGLLRVQSTSGYHQKGQYLERTHVRV